MAIYTPQSTVDFDTISYVGIPSKPIKEPVALDHVHAMIAAVRRSQAVNHAINQTAAAEETLRSPLGHNFRIFDLPQLANAAVATDGKDGLPPRDVHKTLDLQRYSHLKARADVIRPIADRSMRTHQAIISALNLSKISPASVGSMMAGPENLFHSPDFRSLLYSILGALDTEINAAGQGGRVRLRDHLFDLIPLKYKKRLPGKNPDIYLSYGVFELAALMHPVSQRDLELRVLQYNHPRERTYRDVARAVLLQVLGKEAEVADRIELLDEASGLTLVGGHPADTYRMSDEEWREGARVAVNPPPMLDELKEMLLNGNGSFDPRKLDYVRTHVLGLLNTAGQEVLDLGNDDETRRKAVLLKMYGNGGITPADAEFVIEMLHAKIIGPIGKELESKGLTYQSSTMASPDDDDEGEGGMGGGGESGGPAGGAGSAPDEGGTIPGTPAAVGRAAAYHHPAAHGGRRETAESVG